ncbi:hypothetical protein B0H63DRAFT_179644 [Podospora didyma]|uniref:Uncharacterized protein n=1 Tax=Podospora didyma TaxID=330526 RepID=A0AAE0TZF7_9PEZI|nr:hypothetical protein B0H63DRAFT_179644 [Podospora didyma]
MCPVPPTAIWEAIAADSEAPQGMRDAAAAQLHQTALQESVNKAITAATVEPLSHKNPDFTCTIFNLDNKVPWNEWDHGTPGNLKEHVNEAALKELPGNPLQDTAKKFVVANPDSAHDMTFKGLHAVYHFFKTRFRRNSLDDDGLEIRASIHCSRGYDNAYWSTSKQQMVFGDSGRFDGRFWLTPSAETIEEDHLHPEKRLLLPSEKGRFDHLMNHLWPYKLDVIGHEITHGVVAFTAGLGDAQWDAKNYPAFSEAATLNEHIADCFAMMLKHSVANHTPQTGSWEMAPGTWSEYVVKHKGWTGDFVRTFKKPEDPTKSPDSTPKVWAWTERSPWPFAQGGQYGLDPHILCGIPNHAFYLAALEFNDYTWKTVGPIWYDALRDPDFKVPKNQTFLGWKKLTLKHAKSLFPDKGEAILTRAWNQVGMGADFEALDAKRAQ